MTLIDHKKLKCFNATIGDHYALVSGCPGEMWRAYLGHKRSTNLAKGAGLTPSGAGSDCLHDAKSKGWEGPGFHLDAVRLAVELAERHTEGVP